MSDLSRLAYLEQKYDGAIPADELAALRYGSAIDRDIAETQQQQEFYRNMLLRAVKSAKTWRKQGNEKMAQSNRNDAWCYLRSLRVQRRQLIGLLKTKGEK
jgi:hypothetical protein